MASNDAFDDVSDNQLSAVDEEPDSALSWFTGAAAAAAFGIFILSPWGAEAFGDGDHRGRRAGLKNLWDGLGQSGVGLIALGVAALGLVIALWTVWQNRRQAGGR